MVFFPAYWCNYISETDCSQNIDSEGLEFVLQTEQILALRYMFKFVLVGWKIV
jgi:hypothetical protein